MRVDREFHHQELVRALETIDEERLAEIMAEYEADQEVARAIDHSREKDAGEPLLTVKEYFRTKGED